MLCGPMRMKNNIIEDFPFGAYTVDIHEENNEFCFLYTGDLLLLAKNKYGIMKVYNRKD